MSRVVTEPPPHVGRDDSTQGLHRAHEPNDPKGHALVLEPQGQVGVKKTDVREIAGRQGGKRDQGTQTLEELKIHRHFRKLFMSKTLNVFAVLNQEEPEPRGALEEIAHPCTALCA